MDCSFFAFNLVLNIVLPFHKFLGSSYLTNFSLFSVGPSILPRYTSATNVVCINFNVFKIKKRFLQSYFKIVMILSNFSDNNFPQ
jgi:hypothetical protein